MSSSAVIAPPPTSSSTHLHNYLLLAGGYFSLVFAVFQVSAIWWPVSVLQYFGGPVPLKMHRPAVYDLVCILAALIIFAFGFYALSGAGQIRRLPSLHTGLIVVAVIYLLRGLLVVPQILIVLKHPGFVRYALFSAIALVVGVVYSLGIAYLYKHGRPGETRASLV